MLTLSQSIGLGARAIRRTADLTLEAVAEAAKPFGLAWSTGKVSDFESGRIAPTLPTLLAVTAALGAATGRQLSAADLVAGEGQVRINDNMSLDVADLRAALSGKRAALSAKAALSGKYVPVGALLAGTGGLTAEVTVIRRSHLPNWAREVDPSLHAQVLGSFRESDARMCKNLGVQRDVGAAAMAKLWGHTFSDERDRRAGHEAKPQHRGRVSRQLKAALQRAISDGDDQ